MATFRGAPRGGSIRVGVVTEAQVNTPTSPPSSTLNLYDTGSGAMWGAVWFVVAIIVLFFVL